jgi:hypothetical protein
METMNMGYTVCVNNNTRRVVIGYHEGTGTDLKTAEAKAHNDPAVTESHYEVWYTPDAREAKEQGK